MRIREDPKHTDPTDMDTDVDPDPQHWLGQIFYMADINDRPRTCHGEKKIQADFTVSTNRYEKVLLCFLSCGSLVKTSGRKKSAANKEQAKARKKALRKPESLKENQRAKRV
jgi:hypothetical protein